MSLRAHVLWLTAIALSSVLALVVVAAELRPERDEPKPTVALRFDIDAEVGADGTMQVEERFRYAFDRDRVQLRRFYPADEPLPTDWEVLRDGRAEPFRFVPDAEGQLLVVGDGTASGDGVHEYRFRYRVAGVLTREAGTRLFVQELVSPRYSLPVRQGRVTVLFPAVVVAGRCAFGDGTPCEVEGLGTRRLTVGIGAMTPGAGLQLRAGVLTAGVPAVPVPAESPNPGSPSP